MNEDAGMKWAIGSVIGVCAIGLAVFIYLWATSEIMLEHGTVTDKTFVPEHRGSHISVSVDGNGNVSAYPVDEYTPPQYLITVKGSRHTFTMNDFGVYRRFHEGEKVKVVYLSKILHVKEVYGENEQIPVEESP